MTTYQLIIIQGLQPIGESLSRLGESAGAKAYQ